MDAVCGIINNIEVSIGYMFNVQWINNTKHENEREREGNKTTYKSTFRLKDLVLSHGAGNGI